MEYFDSIPIVSNNPNILCVECKKPMKTLFHFCGLKYFYEKRERDTRAHTNNNRTDIKSFYRFKVDTFDRNFYFYRNKIIFSTDDIPKSLNPYLSYINGRFIINQTSDELLE